MPDACVISVVAPALVEQTRWTAGTWLTSETCVEELTRGGQAQRPQTRLMQNIVDGEPAVTVHAVEPGTPAWTMLFVHLRSPERVTTADLGEQECIALCATTLSDAVFTSLDKKALSLALAEIGASRVAHPFEMIESMLDDGLIDLHARDNAWRAIERHSNQPPPWRYLTRGR